MSKQSENIARFYPEVGAGGFTHVDGTVAFYSRVNALLQPDYTVLDLGAGRGAQLEQEPESFRGKLALIQGKVKKIVGVDVDEAVLENRFLDEAHTIRIGEPYPFANHTFDLILSDWVLEHVADPRAFASEVTRIIKPGGWFCARTPNRWGIVGLVAGLIPNSAHAGLVEKLQPGRQSKDVFPTVYRLNTLARLRRSFPKDEWEHFSYLSNPEPPYIQRSRLAMRGVLLAWRLAPSHCKTVLNVFLRKRSDRQHAVSVAQARP